MIRWEVSLLVSLVVILVICSITSFAATQFGIDFDGVFQIVNLSLSTCLLTFCIQAISKENRGE